MDIMLDYKQICEELNNIYSLNDYGFECAIKDNIRGFQDMCGDAAAIIETLQIELAAMRGAANSYKLENKRLSFKLNEALSDLNKVSVCGTCVHYRPCGKETQCDVKKLWKPGANWAGCSRWQWRGEKGDKEK